MKEIKLFGLRLKELRTVKKLSQEKLAQKAGISAKYMSRIEMGQHFPSFDILIKVANALNVEMKDFFEFAHESDNPKVLKKTISELIKDMEVYNLRQAVKLLKALSR